MSSEAAVDQAGAALNALADRYYPDDGNRKPISYFAEYERLFHCKRGSPLRILELGVASGSSLLIWDDYLPNSTIVGLDLKERPASLDGRPRIRFVQASQDDLSALDQVGEAYGPFDFIIDDASHLGYLTKRSFCHLFPHWLKPGGCYVIEDFGTGFLPEYPDGHAFQPVQEDASPDMTVFESHQFGMVGVIKQLIDHMMQELMTGSPSVFEISRMTILTNVVFVEKSITAQNSARPPLGTFQHAGTATNCANSAKESSVRPREHHQTQSGFPLRLLNRAYRTARKALSGPPKQS